MEETSIKVLQADVPAALLFVDDEANILSPLKGIFDPFFTAKPIGKGTRFRTWLPIEGEKSV